MGSASRAVTALSGVFVLVLWRCGFMGWFGFDDLICASSTSIPKALVSVWRSARICLVECNHCASSTPGAKALVLLTGSAKGGALVRSAGREIFEFRVAS